MTDQRTINADTLAELEEERRFLLRSLTDLERELEAGDVDRADYEVLRDGYTARAATVMRAIDHGRESLPPKGRSSRGVVAAWVVGVVVVAALAGWLMARSSGQRLSGQEMTGGAPADEVAVNLAEARNLLQSNEWAAAAERYRTVIELEPTNAEARTYTAWLLVLSAQGASPASAEVAIAEAQNIFVSVTTDEPGYADAHCLYAVTVARFIAEPDLGLASQQGELCLASNPPSDMRGLVTEFLEGLTAAERSVDSIP